MYFKNEKKMQYGECNITAPDSNISITATIHRNVPADDEDFDDLSERSSESIDQSVSMTTSKHRSNNVVSSEDLSEDEEIVNYILGE